VSNRSIGIASIKVIFHEHDSCSDLEYESLRRETSLLEGFDELVSSLGLHLKDEYIFADSIQTFGIVGIDSNIASKKFCMVLCLDGYIARGEEISRMLRNTPRTYLGEDIEERVCSVISSL
jgi:hypothetical protein